MSEIQTLLLGFQTPYVSETEHTRVQILDKLGFQTSGLQSCVVFGMAQFTLAVLGKLKKIFMEAGWVFQDNSESGIFIF